MIQKKFFKWLLPALSGLCLASMIAGWSWAATVKAPSAVTTEPVPAKEDAAVPGSITDIVRMAQESGRPLTPAEALKVLTYEAEKGNAEAMLNLGTFYERGYGVPRHLGRALAWYQKAAGLGLPQGYYNTGVSYEIGIGVTPDLAKAKANYEKASQGGLALADYKLSTLYYHGEGVAKSEGKALEYLIKAAEGGHPQANSDLGGIYHQGLWEQPKDPAKAATHIKLAAEAGLPEAMKNMAALFVNGHGVSQDNYEAAKWYRLAQMAGYPGLEEAITETSAKLPEARKSKLEEELKKWVEDYNQKNSR